MNGESTEFVICYKCLRSLFKRYDGPKEDGKIKADEGLKTFELLKIRFKVRGVS